MTYTSWLMSNHTTKMTEVPIEIDGNVHFISQFFLDNVIDVKNLLLEIKIFQSINILISFSPPKCFIVY